MWSCLHSLISGSIFFWFDITQSWLWSDLMPITLLTFPSICFFLLSSSLTALARTFSTELKRRKRRLLWLWSRCYGECGCVSPLNVTFSVEFSDILYQVKEVCFYSKSAECFYHRYWILLYVFFCIYWNDMIVFFILRKGQIHWIIPPPLHIKTILNSWDKIQDNVLSFLYTAGFNCWYFVKDLLHTFPNAGGGGFDPWSEHQIPHAATKMWCPQINKNVSTKHWREKKKKTEAWPFSVTTKCPERLIKPLCACWSRHEHLPGLCELWEFSGLQPPALCLDQWSFTTLVLGLLVDDGSTDWRNFLSRVSSRSVLGSPNPSCICSVPLAGHVISAPLGFSLSVLWSKKCQ